MPGRFRHRIFERSAGAFQNRQLAVTTINSTTTTDSPTPRVDESTFDLYVELEADDLATPEQLAVLDADKVAWRASLLRLLVDADEHLVAARRLQGEERDQVVADAEHLHRSLTAALLAPHRRAPPRRSRGARRARARRRPPPSPRRSCPASCGSSCRGNRAGSWPGPVVPGAHPPPATRSPSSSPTPRPPPRRGPPTPTSRCPAATRPRRSPRPSARCSAGWSPPDPARCATTSAPASAGWARSRCGRSSSPPAARWCPCCASAAVAPTPPAATTRRTRCAGRPPWSTPNASPTSSTPCPAASPPSTRASTPVPSPAPRSPAWSTPSAATAPAASRCPPRRPSCAPATTSPKRSSPASTAARSTRRCASPVSSSSRAEGWARSVTREHAPLIVRLDPPDRTGVWDLEVFVAKARGGSKGKVLVPVERAIVDDRSKRADLEARARPPRAHAARAAARRHRPPRPDHPQPGRGVGAHGHHRPAASPTPASTCGSPSCRPARPRRRCGCSPSRRRPRSAPTSSPTCAGRRCSTTSSSPPPRSAELAKEARPLIRSGGQWVALDKADLARRGQRARRAGQRPRSSPAPTCCASPSASRARRSPAASRVEGGGWAADLLAAAADLSGEPAAAPEGFDGELRSYQAEALAWLGLPRRRRPRRLPRPRHGPRQDAHDARPPARGRRPRPVARDRARRRSSATGRPRPKRFTPGLRVVVHHGAGRAAADEIADEVERRRRRHHHLRHRGARRRRDRRRSSGRRVVLDEAQAIKNPTSDTAQQLRRIDARTRVALTGTPIENGLGDLWAILDFTNPGLVGPRPQFIASLSGDGERCAAVARRGRGRAARAQRHPRVPPHQGRAGDRRRAARPHRRARPLRDDPRADRSLPGGARPARARRPTCPRARSRARARSSPPSPRSSRSATTPPPTRTTTGRSPVARASWRGSRRSSTRCSPPASACWCSPTSPSGA